MRLLALLAACTYSGPPPTEEPLPWACVETPALRMDLPPGWSVTTEYPGHELYGWNPLRESMYGGEVVMVRAHGQPEFYCQDGFSRHDAVCTRTSSGGGSHSEGVSAEAYDATFFINLSLTAPAGDGLGPGVTTTEEEALAMALRMMESLQPRKAGDTPTCVPESETLGVP